MNEFELKAYRQSRKNKNFIGGVWIYPYEEDNTKEFIVFYKHKDNIWIENCLSDSPDEKIEEYEKKVRSIENSIEGSIDYIEGNMYDIIQNDGHLSYIRDDLYLTMQYQINVMRRIGYLVGYDEYLLDDLQAAGVGKIERGKSAIEIYQEVLQHCNINNEDLEEFIKNLPIKIETRGDII